MPNLISFGGKFCLYGTIALAASSCSKVLTSNPPLFNGDTLNFKVSPAPEWTNKFYKNEGFLGADGIFEMTLSGDESIGAGEKDSVLMYFSDTMTGSVVGDSSIKNFKMINNSFAWITNGNRKNENFRIFYNTSESGEPLNYFNPETPQTQPGDYYWFGDGFVNQDDNNSINIFGYRTFDKSKASWDFEIRGVTLITIPGGAAFSEATQIDLPLMADVKGKGKGTFGAGIFVNTKRAGAKNPDGYIYVFGVLDPNKQLVVARVKPIEIRSIGAWRFWNGKTWDPSINHSHPITDRVSNELSLTQLPDGRFLLVFQADGLGNHTAVRIGHSPIGPFGPLQKIWKVPELSEPPGLIPYNAKAHPVLSKKNRLLISYNTISFDYLNEIHRFPHMYRPRFFWLEIQ
jgi:hypothetical protein